MSEKIGPTSSPGKNLTWPPPNRMWLHSFLWALVVTAVLVGLSIGLVPLSDVPVEGQPRTLLQTSRIFQVLFVFFAFLVLFFCRWAWLSRSVADHLFRFTGFFATFFGLAILALFLISLGAGIYSWFQIMPVLIEKENRHLRRILERGPEEIFEEEMVGIRREMNLGLKQFPSNKKITSASLASLVGRLATSEGKGVGSSVLQASLSGLVPLYQEYENDIIPFLRQEIAIRTQERKLAAARGIRDDTSSLALLWYFLTSGPSNQSQNAGIYPAILGSLGIALITMFFAVPIGVGAALYLEEYRAKTWLGYLIQININNLAGVPSVVYGILGAFVFVEMIFKPLERLQPHIAARNLLGGGLTLGLLTLPVVIVAAQEAIRAVPQSIRQGAFALGATRWQVIWHQVLPMARPGILTGTILAISRAIGEAAPLVLFGALLFVNQEPGLFSRFTVLPMQIFGWADRPEERIDNLSIPVWQYNAALTSMVLLLMLLIFNAIAIILRSRTQKQMRL